LGVAFRAKPLVRQSAKQAISTLGLDGVLYLLGFRDRDARGSPGSSCCKACKKRPAGAFFAG
jgi:hypothetical protein